MSNMISPITNTLLKVHQLLSPVTNNWMLIGSTSLFLQGYPVEPNDVDILCPAAEVRHLEFLLKDYRVKLDANTSREKFRSVFSNYIVDDIKVEVMGGLEINTPTGWIKLLEEIEQPESVLLNTFPFKVPSKADQRIIYSLFGREKDKAILKILR